MNARARWLQLLGALLFLATAFAPLHFPAQHPQCLAHARNGHATVPPGPAAREAVPARDLCDAALHDLAARGQGSRLWEVRRWYPYALAPLWIVALLLTGGAGAAAQRRRGWVGPALLVLAVALVVLEACYLGTEYLALLPGVLGTFDSAESDSFHSGLLDSSYYTRPATFRGWDVPSILLSGDHAKIAGFRREDALRRTFERRPDLLEGAELSDEDRRFLARLRARERESDRS